MSNIVENEINVVKQKDKFDLFDKLDKEYMSLFNDTSKPMEFSRLMQLIGIISGFENFDERNTYKISESANIDDIFKKYTNDISSDINEFYKDLIYLYRWGYIWVGYQNNIKNEFVKKSRLATPYRNSLDLYDFIISFNNYHQEGKYGSFSGVVYFTKEGDSLKKDNFGEYLLEKYTKIQFEKELELESLRSKTNEIETKIDGFHKEIISMVSIILSIVPIIAINISQLDNFEISRILIVNGVLLTIITSILFSIKIAFFNLNKKLLFLIIPIVIGLILIVCGLAIESKGDIEDKTISSPNTMINYIPVIA